MQSKLLLCSSLLVASVAGHGLIRKPLSRMQRCGVEIKPHEKAGTDCEDAFEFDSNGGYQFMSVLTHALGRDSVRPLPTNVCGFDSETWNGGRSPWDEPIDWPTSDMSAGTNEFIWDIQWGPHFDDTMDFKYWITNEDYVWQVGKDLTWDDFGDTPFCSIDFDYNNPGDVQMNVDGVTFVHNCEVPARSGRHIIYGEWGRNPNTYERFHGCSDVIFSGGSAPVTTPTTPTPPAATPTPPAATPTPPASTPTTPTPPASTPTTPTPPVTTPTPVVSGCTGGTIGLYQACTNSVNCCAAGSACEGNEWYRQCRPSSSGSSPSTPSTATCNLHQACKDTPDCCPSGSSCYKNNDWYSQCLEACPAGWECNNVQSTPTPASNPVPPTTPTPPVSTPTPLATPTPASPPVTTPTPPVATPPSTPSGGSGNLISLDFESESVSTIPTGWETFTNYSPNLASATSLMYVDNTRAYSGSKSFKVMGPSNGPAQIVKRLTTDPPNVYFRAYYWLSDTMGNQAGDNHEQIMGTKKYESATRPFSADAEIRVGQAKGHLGFNQVPTDSVSPPYSQWYSGPQIPKEQWVCVEAAVLTDAAFDELHMWVNDDLVNSATSSADWHSPMDSNWAEGLISNVYFGWHSFSQRGMDMWIDDIEVSTERIGC